MIQQSSKIGNGEGRFENDNGATTVLAAAPRAAARCLAVATAVVGLLGIAAAVCRFGFGIQHGPIDIVQQIDLQGEDTLPAWYSSVLLLLAGLLLGLVGWVKATRRARFVWHWLILGFIFLLLSADETVQFHERASWPFERVLKLKGAFLYGWVIPAILFVGVIGLSYLKFLLHLPRRTRWRFIVAGAVYVGAALGLEMVEGVWDTAHGKDNVVYMAMVVVEEIGEMVGVAIFIHALLLHLRDECGQVTFDLAPDERSACASVDPEARTFTADTPGSAPPDRADAPGAAQPDRLGV
jgi:hypothetical protein